MRWDMWGHTWDDLAHADTRMGQPWATLRSLAIYKPKEASWGIDYFSSSSMRAVGSETGFNDEAMDNFQRWGQLPWLPMFLQEQGLNPEEEDVWMKYVTRTAKKVQTFMELVVFIAISFYAILFAVVSIMQTKRSWAHAFTLSLLRLGAGCTFAYVVFVGLRNHVDSTRWAADIRGGRRYSSVFENELAFGVKRKGVTTLPHRKDVLIENRFGSRYLHMYNDFVNGHPGNRYFISLVDAVRPTFAKYPEWLQEASAHYIAQSVLVSQGRFLEQGVHGKWFLNDFEEALAHTKKELVARSYPVAGEILQELRYIISGYRFSTLRDTAMAQKHLGPYMQTLQKRIVKIALMQQTKLATNMNVIYPASMSPAASIFKVTPSVVAPSSDASKNMRTPSLKFVPGEPEPGAWFSTGSIVEAFTEGFWFIGEVASVDAFGNYFVKFPDGDEQYFGTDYIRVYEPYTAGERLQVYQEGFYDYEDCEIIARADDGTYHALVHGRNKYIEGIDSQYFRRYHFGGQIETRTYMGAY